MQLETQLHCDVAHCITMAGREKRSRKEGGRRREGGKGGGRRREGGRREVGKEE